MLLKYNSLVFVYAGGEWEVEESFQLDVGRSSPIAEFVPDNGFPEC